MCKVLVVIGASSDIGMAFIEKYGQEYEKIAVFYRHSNEKLEALLAKYKEGSILRVKCDFAGEEGYYHLWDKKEAMQNFCGQAQIYMVHFPASPIKNKKYHKSDWKEFQEEVDISVKSFVICSQYFLPMMIKQKNGRIVVCLSKAVEGEPPKYCADYVMVKYALLGLVRSLAVEYGDLGLRINAVSPAMVDTKFLVYQPEVIINGWKDQSKSGELLSPGVVADKIVWLFSKEAEDINGKNFVVE